MLHQRNLLLLSPLLLINYVPNVQCFQVPISSHRKKKHIQNENHARSSLNPKPLQNIHNRNRHVNYISSSTSLQANNIEDNSNNGKAKISFSSTPSTMKSFTSPTDIIDFILSSLVSDIGSIVLGLVGLFIALTNRLIAISTYENVDTATSNAVDLIGEQSRIDLLAIFAAGAVLLNGISKLDVTSALAENVLLEGIFVQNNESISKYINPEIYNRVLGINVTQGNKEQEKLDGKKDFIDLDWTMNSLLESTPAKTAVLLMRFENEWIPILVDGILPTSLIIPSVSSSTSKTYKIPEEINTPILNRFLKQNVIVKETYLPTLQALPGKVEFTYLPPNAQEALLLPIVADTSSNRNDDSSASGMIFALVVGSERAKSFTPRDIAWCQVVANRLGDQISKLIH